MAREKRSLAFITHSESSSSKKCEFAEMNTARLCQKDGCMKQAAPSQRFCSRAHAPLGNYGLSKSDRYSERKPTDLSSTPEPGERSARSLNAEPWSEKDMKQLREVRNSDSKKLDDGSVIANGGPKKTLSESSENGENSSTGKELELLPKDSKELSDSTPSTDLSATSLNLKKEHLGSMSLLDDSTIAMYGLMKSSAIAIKKELETEGTVDTQMVNAAAHCARQIVSLLRLKTEIVKEIRK